MRHNHSAASSFAQAAAGVIWGLSLMSAGASIAAAAEGAAEEGPLTNLAEPLSHLLQLTLDGRTLRLDRDSWKTSTDGKSEEELLKEQTDKLIANGLPKEIAERQAALRMRGGPVDRLWNQIQAASGSMGSSRSSGGARNKMSFEGPGVSASLSYNSSTVGGPFQVTVSEESGPGRSLRFSTDGTKLQLTITGGADSDFYLQVSQAEDGQFRVLHVTEDKVVRLKDENFLTFYSKNRQYTEKELLPALKRFGIGLPMTPYDTKIRQAVLDQLRGPSTAADAKRGEELIEQLGSGSFAKREEAMKLLSEGFRRYADAIEDAARKSTEPEVTDRLKKILQDNADARKVTGMVSALKLAKDPTFLVLLLKDCKEGDRDAVVKALEAATGQKFGNDVAAWEKWLSATAPTKPASQPATKSDPAHGAI